MLCSFQWEGEAGISHRENSRLCCLYHFSDSLLWRWKDLSLVRTCHTYRLNSYAILPAIFLVLLGTGTYIYGALPRSLHHVQSS